MEVKWSLEGETFAEAQVSAYASYFSQDDSGDAMKYRWLPVFVLSKEHFQIGLAFFGVGGRWVFSEICKHSTDRLDLLQLLRFCNFFIDAAQYHKSKIQLCNTDLVDCNGNAILKEYIFIGTRVLLGKECDDHTQRKTLKFFATEKAAQSAILKETEGTEILQYVRKPTLVEGCGGKSGDGMWAVMDNYIEGTRKITYSHLLDLCEQINTLYLANFVHGDLRAPNIRFVRGGKVFLIDFELAGCFTGLEEAKFPDNINKEAFGPNAREVVSGGMAISPNFDWLCLADLLQNMGCKKAAGYALNGDIQELNSELLTLQNEGNIPNESECEKIARFGNIFTLPNLRGLDNSRLDCFYSKRYIGGKLAESRRGPSSQTTGQTRRTLGGARAVTNRDENNSG
jgi:hypothetical protein